jgi:imidazolonepropionase-like amidohydrolase
MTRTVFRGGSVFDGTGAAPAAADVAVENGRFVDIGAGLDGDEQVDATGRTLLPGFFDCHTHVMVSTIDHWKMAQTPFSYRFFEGAKNLEATLRIGITSVRDAGFADLGLKQAVEDGLIPGPRMQISISIISQTGGHGDDWMASGITLPWISSHPGLPETIVDGPDEMRRVVRTLIRAGADVIKVATSGGVLSPRDQPHHGHFRDEELAVLADEAAAAGVRVMAHAQASDGIKAAIRAGFASIDHGVYLDDEAIELMLERGTFLVPTLVAVQGVIDAAEAGAQIPAASLGKARAVRDIHFASFRSAVAAGVKIAMGTDSGVTPHGQNLRELPLMAEAGMSPSDVLVATTSRAAELLGWEDRLGTIEPGKIADVVILDGDPFELETLSERIQAVYKDGRLVSGAVN